MQKVQSRDNRSTDLLIGCRYATALATPDCLAGPTMFRGLSAVTLVTCSQWAGQHFHRQQSTCLLLTKLTVRTAQLCSTWP